MRSKPLILVSSLAILALLAACAANSPGTNSSPAENAANLNTDAALDEPAEQTTPMVEISDQDASSGSITVDQVAAADPGWIVIHTEADGAPGPIVGYAAVNAGKNSQVEVDIDLEAATEKLFAMLHLDAGTPGSYEFPGDDVPVKAGDAVVMAPFMITKADASMGSSMEATKVTVKDSKFESKEITVKVGTTVTWMMNASFPHTVTADDGSFDSGRMGNGETFTFTFEQAGEFPYYCSLHGGPGGSGMAGTVTVTE